MSRIFMSVVGTGNYESVQYTLDGQSENNRFVQKALLKILNSRNEHYDKIIFFLTREAKSMNWEQYLRKKQGTPIEDEGLAPFLDKEFPKEKFPSLQIKSVKIASGEREEELLQMFQTIYAQIETGDQITFDITHGFRIMPFLFFPVMNYAKELKKIVIEHIYYGMYSPGCKEAPIVDLKQYDQIMEWANAAHNFIHFGNATEFKDLYFRRYNSMDSAGKRTLSPTKGLAARLGRFTDALLTCRGAGGDAIQRIAKDIEQYMSHNKDALTATEYVLFDQILEHMLVAVRDFQGELLPYEIGMRAAKWYMDKDLVQQAYTALRETVITFCCHVYASEQEYLDYSVREDVVQTALNALKPARHTPETISALHRKNLNRLSGNRELQYIYLRMTSHLQSNQLGFFNSLCLNRNDLNHFGMKVDASLSKKIKKDLTNQYAAVEAFIRDVQSRQQELLSDDAAAEALAQLMGSRKNFINFSNHPSTAWTQMQVDAAMAMAPKGQLIDVKFPNVSADADENHIKELQERCVSEIMQYMPAVVMCQGEFGTCYAVVCALQQKGVKVVYSCTERCVNEVVSEDSTHKYAVFRFTRFREYQECSLQLHGG